MEMVREWKTTVSSPCYLLSVMEPGHVGGGVTSYGTVECDH